MDDARLGKLPRFLDRAGNGLAARFANWMHNGQGSGSTETGAYTLSGITSGIAPARNAGARFYIPTENEWFKAAFYSPNKSGLGSPGYYAFATQSDAAPGNSIGGSPNQANYLVNGNYTVTQALDFDPDQNYLTDVGAFTDSASYYGTFDQSGNVWEWNDLDGGANPFRGIRAGAWTSDADTISSSQGAAVDPSFESPLTGFRLAGPVAVPEPSTWMLAAGGLACAACWGAFRRRRGRGQAWDPT